VQDGRGSPASAASRIPFLLLYFQLQAPAMSYDRSALGFESLHQPLLFVLRGMALQSPARNMDSTFHTNPVMREAIFPLSCSTSFADLAPQYSIKSHFYKLEISMSLVVDQLILEGNCQSEVLIFQFPLLGVTFTAEGPRRGHSVDNCFNGRTSERPFC